MWAFTVDEGKIDCRSYFEYYGNYVQQNQYLFSVKAICSIGIVSDTHVKSNRVPIKSMENTWT